MDSPFSNFMQILAYVGGPLLLGCLIAFGIMRSRVGRSGPVERIRDSETKRLYAAEENDRAAKEKAPRKSSNPIDVVERETDTTG